MYSFESSLLQLIVAPPDAAGLAIARTFGSVRVVNAGAARNVRRQGNTFQSNRRAAEFELGVGNFSRQPKKRVSTQRASTTCERNDACDAMRATAR
jgi:hypothetical protein